MQTQSLFTTIFCFHALLFSFFASAAENPQQKILVFGDSLSAAYGINEEQGWVALLQNRLMEQHPNYRIINASISGETTGGGLRRLPQALAEHKPDIVILELGANDGLRGFPLNVIRRNLASLIEVSQNQGAKVLLAGIHIPPNFGPAYTSQFFSQFSELSEKFNTAYLPFLLENVALTPGLLQADRLHPTEQAQPLILDNIWEQLLPLL